MNLYDQVETLQGSNKYPAKQKRTYSIKPPLGKLGKKPLLILGGIVFFLILSAVTYMFFWPKQYIKVEPTAPNRKVNSPFSQPINPFEENPAVYINPFDELTTEQPYENPFAGLEEPEES